MNDAPAATVIAFDARHERSWSLLPWWVNGTLKGEELALVERHVAHCATCRDETRSLRLLAQHLRKPDVESRCEDALSRLHARLTGPRMRHQQAPWASAAVLVLVFGLVGYTGNHAQSSMAWLRNMGVSKMAQSPLANDDVEPSIARLVFYNDITEGQLRALLLSVGAELKDGPTQLGVYTISFGHNVSSDEALARLRHSGKVVYAEPAITNAVSALGSW